MKIINSKIVLVLFLFISSTLFSQEKNTPFEGHHGDFYFSWGYNRAFFNESDIHFKGEGYDFTIYKVEARDLPETFDAKVYFNITKFSIPQFNFRAGYFLNDKFSISIGTDHMKYVMVQDQEVKINGTIDTDLSETYGGIYNNDYINLSRDFLRYEHTNGFNFARIGLEYRAELWESNNKKHKITIMPGVGFGPMLPWTNYTFLNDIHSDLIHLGGVALSFTSTFRYEFKNNGYIQFQGQNGYAILNRVVLEDRSGKASAKQNISFFERSLSIGFYLHSLNKHKQD